MSLRVLGRMPRVQEEELSRARTLTEPRIVPAVRVIYGTDVARVYQPTVFMLSSGLIHRLSEVALNWMTR
jgi:hypothetical protein